MGRRRNPASVFFCLGVASAPWRGGRETSVGSGGVFSTGQIVIGGDVRNVPRLTDLQKKGIVADFADGDSMRKIAKKYKVSTTTVHRTVRCDPETEQKIRQKKEQNTADILAYMESKRDIVCEILGKGLNVLNSQKKLAEATPAQITTALGTSIDKWTAIRGGPEDTENADDLSRTLAGIFLDEVALMPESFFNQALARCSVDGARLWFSCNPENPQHWFYTNWIQRHDERNALYLRFGMTDNPSLSEKTLARYQAMYSGVFYQRYIQGLWVSAEGKIYISFSPSNIIPKVEWDATDEQGKPTHPIRRRISTVTMGVDFEGNKSSHAFVLTGFTRGYREIITLKELRIREEIDPTELEGRFVRFVRECKKEYSMLSTVYCDSAEQVLIRGFRNAARANHLSIYVRNAAKGEIIDRIRFYCAMQAQRRHMILSDCTETIKAFEDALWDPDKEDTRLDNGSTNIDNLDAQEYSSEPYMKIMLDMTGHGESDR